MNSAPPSGRAGTELELPGRAGRFAGWDVARHFLAENRPLADVGALANSVAAH
jgi:hypothetical protein